MSDRPDRLNKEEHQRIFHEKVLPRSDIESFAPQEHPKAVILAGQPGAGKGNLRKATEIEFKGDIFAIDPDEQREFHPEAKRWQKESPYGWSQKTNSDAGAWAGELRNAGVERRVNLLVDTTLGDARSATRLTQGLQKAGYEVEIRAVAAHELESRVGVDRRITSKVDAAREPLA
jgi:predicted ABC-type ATPase